MLTVRHSCLREARALDVRGTARRLSPHVPYRVINALFKRASLHLAFVHERVVLDAVPNIVVHGRLIVYCLEPLAVGEDVRGHPAQRARKRDLNEPAVLEDALLLTWVHVGRRTKFQEALVQDDVRELRAVGEGPAADDLERGRREERRDRGSLERVLADDAKVGVVVEGNKLQLRPAQKSARLDLLCTANEPYVSGAILLVSLCVYVLVHVQRHLLVEWGSQAA